MILVARFTDGLHAIELGSINSKTVVKGTVAIYHPLNHLLANYNTQLKADQG